MPSRVPTNQQKALGAFYTSDAVSAFLAAWAIRSPGDTVLEPSFGGGAFLHAAAERLYRLGGSPWEQVYGRELDDDAHAAFSNNHAAELDLDTAKLSQGDFFTMSTSTCRVSALIGNPPFVRYHLFSGAARQQALSRAREAGVALSELSSSWAPFLVHSTRFLVPHGRLAMVIPLELLHAAYARPVLRYLKDSFARVTLLTFDRKLFPRLSQDTLLVLADDFGNGPGTLHITRLSGPEQLTHDADLTQAPSQVLDVDGIETGNVRAAIYKLSSRARCLYERLAGNPMVRRLGDIADVGIGYVTGANDYFHLSAVEAGELGLNPADLRPAVRRGRDLAATGLSITTDDWASLAASGGKYRLFWPQGELDAAAARYVGMGERANIHTAYKCRTRSPWWRVPWVVTPDLFLTVMSGTGPRLVANDAGLVATNTLHTVRLRQTISPRVIAAAAITSLSTLSAEIEGHALGGGMLKLEPSEAGRLLLPLPREVVSADALARIDGYIREGNMQGATALADEIFLMNSLGLTVSDVNDLRTALQDLISWRRQR